MTTQIAASNKLIKNIALFSLIYVIPKIMGFFLIPVYTSYLSSEDYGISELVISTASFLLPIFSLSINNAVFRFTIENKNDENPFNVGIRHWFISGSLLSFSVIAIIPFGFVDANYLFLIVAIFVSNALSDIFIAYASSQEKMKLITFCGICSNILLLSTNILFIVYMELGAYGFIFSTIIGYLFNVCILLSYIILKRKIHFSLFFRSSLSKDMYKYSIPLVFSGLSWWIYSCSDRYFIGVICGVSEMGIYTVAYKLPSILQMVQTVLTQAWQFSIYDLYKSEEGRKRISQFYELCFFVVGLSASLIISFDLFLSKFLYKNEFFIAWKCVPLLVFSVVLITMGTVISTVLTAYKQTKIQAKIAIGSAVLNCMLNMFIINITKNAMGAALATVITSFISNIITTRISLSIGNIHINKLRFWVINVILILECMFMICFQSMYICLLLTVILLIINVNNTRILLKKAVLLLGCIK